MKKLSNKGFTLIELLIVIAIIAILAAIAIPQFSAYKKRGYVATLSSDCHNAATAATAFFGTNPGSTLDLASLLTAGLHVSGGDTIAVTNATEAGWTLTCTGLAGWGLTTNVAQIDVNGNFTPAAP